MMEYPTSGCWNQARHSVFYVTTAVGQLIVWDILQTLRNPVFTLKLCKQKLTCLAPCEEGATLAIGNYGGKVFLVEPTDYFQSFDRKDRSLFLEVSDHETNVFSLIAIRIVTSCQPFLLTRKRHAIRVSKPISRLRMSLLATIFGPGGLSNRFSNKIAPVAFFNRIVIDVWQLSTHCHILIFDLVNRSGDFEINLNSKRIFIS